MALTATQKVDASEATRETLERVVGAASSLTAEQETAISTELVKYNATKDKIKIELKGEVNLSNRVLLEEIRQRIRKHFGWTLLSSEMTGVPVAVPYAGGVSSADKQSNSGDADSVGPAFRRDLFEWS